MADDPNFSKLPARDRELHRWAEPSQGDTPNLDVLEMLLDCPSADGVTKDQTHPLGDRPLVDVTAGNPLPGPPAMLEKWRVKCEELQTKLLSLSKNSKRIVAQESLFHYHRQTGRDRGSRSKSRAGSSNPQQLRRFNSRLTRET
ncbi:MAG: hypothetical protein WA715_11680 [Candidatus Acidiferrum sp.]